MANPQDTMRLSGTELRRRLTMPAGETAPAPLPKDEDTTDFFAESPSEASIGINQLTPVPSEAPRLPELSRAFFRKTEAATPAPVPSASAAAFASPVNAGPVSPASDANSPILDDFFPEAKATGQRTNANRDPQMDRIQQLESENNDMRELLDEMRHLMQDANDSELRYKQALEQHIAHISDLEAKLADAQSRVGSEAPRPAIKNIDELEEWSDELEKENIRLTNLRRDLDDERRQLRQDEAGLEKQMREMEVSMAKERAMLARQEVELRRLNMEIQQELELMQRGDPTLRERMMLFQRRHQDILARAGAAPSAGGPPPAPGGMMGGDPAAGVPQAAPYDPSQGPATKQTDSSVLRRLFRK